MVPRFGYRLMLDLFGLALAVLIGTAAWATHKWYQAVTWQRHVQEALDLTNKQGLDI